jgi:VWFA-related protein
VPNRDVANRVWATIGAAGVLCGTALLAQQPAQPTPQQRPPLVERVEVTRVVIDARVIDDYGAAILGLAAPDFSVTIGGKPARVQMALWSGDTAPRGPSGALLSARNMPGESEPGQLVVLLFQKSLTNERAWGLVRTIEYSRDLVRSLPASARVAVLQYENSLRVYSDFTDDRAAIDRLLTRGLLHQPPPSAVPRGSPSLLDALAPSVGREIFTMEQAFAAIAGALNPMPGSKAIAYIGYGMGNPAFGLRQDTGITHAKFGALPDDLADKTDMNSEYARARRMLIEARVSVFSLDITKADTHTMAGGMQIIARDTGGFYAHSLDFPEKPMRFVSGALNGHYVLFVEPPADATDRTIEVSVTAGRRAQVFATSSYRAPEK